MTELRTNAERLADKARELPGFKGFSLPAVRERITELLSLIGREGIFATYTVHDIRHIDAMLKMLDWLVPPSTIKTMTSVDWLMVVLAIYLHDLGLLVTADEYQGRRENPEYLAWFDLLSATQDGREYLGRTDRMTPDEKERFFFQEYVRKGHAQRVREWITGRHSRSWGREIEPVANAIAEMLRHLPVRFRDSLGAICESHHKADLDNATLYPLITRFGNEPDETANIQYAAILLRTADVLHVTKDRTPSVMFQLIRFSDPKSVTEWDKQLGAFSVGLKSRQLIESDPQTAIIQINADFTEERPLFALQEYVAYADGEVKQSRRWIEKSQESPDGKGYGYPWHEVSSDIRLEGVPPQPLRFELDRGRLLDLLVGHTIYNDPTVAVRELLQNAIDAVRYQGYLDRKSGDTPGASSKPGSVEVRWNSNDRILVVQDNGVGMDRDVIRHHLMSVGSSYYNTPQFEVENRDFAAISRFGIGILTCFMVSDDVEIITVREQKGHRIRMTSVQSTYLLKELEVDDLLLAGLNPHGTRVTIRLRTTVNLSKRSLEEIVRYWIILPECPVIFSNNDREPVRIGFDSPVEALEYYRSSAEQRSRSFEDSKLEILSAERQSIERSGDTIVKVSYEMAFAVRAATSHIPERSFAFGLALNAPAICIEGIRVSDFLPGFESKDLSVLLSVRGSRRFRTTVSRDGLEIDEEYENVAKLSAGMLAEHLNNEVSRLAMRAGKPLSLASSAARWLFDGLHRAAYRPYVETHLQNLFNQLPSIVVERLENTGDRPTNTRSLMSAEDLESLPQFWTLESRSVDSLGVISRDLGRELSLNEFLAALAPDITQLRYSPILPDAHDWIHALRRSFRPERVEFSRAHQQSAIRWLRLTAQDHSAGFEVRKLLSADRLNRLSANLGLGGMRQQHLLTYYIDIGELVGDDPSVSAVASRVGILLKSGSVFERIWDALITRIRRLASDSESFDNLVTTFEAADHFRAYFSTGETSESFKRRQPLGERPLEKLSRSFDECGLSDILPPNWADAFTRGAVFEARRLWRTWNE